MFCPTCGKLLVLSKKGPDQEWTCGKCGPVKEAKPAEVMEDGKVEDPFWNKVRSREAKHRFLKKKYEESLWGRFSSRR